MTRSGQPAPGAIRRSLVVPLYDEAGRIEAAVAALASSSLNDDGTEFVFVDDGSTDRSDELAEAAAARAGLGNVRVVRHPVNQGKGAAVRTGVLESAGEAVAFVDADLAAGVDEIERCFAVIEGGSGDVVFTTRLHADSVITRQPPLSRRVAGKAFNLLLRLLGMTRYNDTQCGLKAFRSEAARELFRDLRVHRFAFDVEVLAMADRLGLDVVELPITWHHMDASRVSTMRDGIRMGADVLRLRWAIRNVRPDRQSAAMTADQFEVMGRVERDHWWWQAKRKLVAHEIAVRAPRPGPGLDVGCGTGGTVAMLSAMGFKPAVGTDVSSDALATGDARRDPAVALLRSRAERLPFAAASMSCLTSLDVIEHLDDDVRALREFRRVVAPGGVIVIAVPAYQWAWSDHDVVLGHRRRYTARQLEAAAGDAGLDVERCTHYHSWLVLPAFLLRRTPLRRLVRGSAEEASYAGPAVNRLLGRIASVERRVARRWRVPFGLSILLVARVPESDSSR